VVSVGPNRAHRDAIATRRDRPTDTRWTRSNVSVASNADMRSHACHTPASWSDVEPAMNGARQVDQAGLRLCRWALRPLQWMRESSRDAMRRKILALGGAGLLALAACSGGTHHAVPTTTSPPPSTTAAPNPDVIPPVITVAYINAVFAVLFHIYGNATRLLVSTHHLSPAIRADFRSIYNDPLYPEEIQIAQQSLAGTIDNVRPHPGDGIVRVKDVMSASDTCLLIATTTDLSAVLLRPTPMAASEYYELTPKQKGIDPGRLNATPWAISFNVAYLTPSTIADRCGS
jgi:hypothetical protein